MSTIDVLQGCPKNPTTTILVLYSKDLSKVKPEFKSVPLQIYFEIAGLASAKKWREIQNMAGEELF